MPTKRKQPVTETRRFQNMLSARESRERKRRRLESLEKLERMTGEHLLYFENNMVKRFNAIHQRLDWQDFRLRALTAQLQNGGFGTPRQSARTGLAWLPSKRTHVP
jgi:hypothetical protein